jgi:soluble lytic murein transglycosylase
MHTRRLLLNLSLILIILAVAGCDVSGDTIVITATPVHAPETPAQPYITPTTALVAVPTRLPNPTLGAAQQAIQFGNHDQALQIFDDLAAQADAELMASAAFGRAEAYVREGMHTEATGALSAFIREYPDDVRIPHAHFMRADAYLALDQWQLAINDYNTYLSLRPGVLDSYAYERMAEAYTALGQSQQARTFYARAADAPRTVASQVALREDLAAEYLAAGQVQAAIDQYDAILQRAENDDYRAYIEYQIAQLLLNNGSTTPGYTRLQTIVDQYPATHHAYLALGQLLTAQYDIDFYTRGRINYENGYYQTAVDDLNTHVDRTGDAPPDLLLMLGRAYRSLGQTESALRVFQMVLDRYPPGDPAFGEAWLAQGRTLFQNNDIEGAIIKYLALAENHPDVPQGAEALARAGYLYAMQDDVANAVSTFNKLNVQYPDSEWTHSFYQASAYLYLGERYLEGGQDDAARQMLEQATQADPGSFESVRAGDLLHGRAPFEPPDADTLVFEFDEARELTQAEAWMKTTFGITGAGPLYALGPELETDGRMIRGRELLLINDYDAAEQEFDALRTAYRDDPLALYQLAVYLRGIKLYRLSITAAANLITLAGIDTLSAPPYIARLRYPVYYQALVLPESAANDLDPLLVFSLIRQESLFEGYATSFAAAQGLMQIIPDTGAWVAEQLAWENYVNSDVYRPFINVKFGAFYLSWVFEFVGGEDVPYAALAGYNGGPGNAVRWLEASGEDFDRFVETIDFPETRAYVTRIYEQYAIYRALYSVAAAG